MSGVEVIIEDLKEHPCCPHGPTILFSRKINNKKRNFYACSACRDRKHCSFFLYEDEKDKINKNKSNAWEQERRKFLNNTNHRKLFLKLNEIKNLPENERGYCHTCSRFELKKFWENHKDHSFVKGIDDYALTHPSEFLPPLEDAKKEAQFLFAQSSVKAIVDLCKSLNKTKVICIGTPRLHEYITSECSGISSILLDIDGRYHNFYGPLEFCWYNSFNNHFFLPESRQVFMDFLEGDPILVMDPPFGGRVEPLAQTLTTIGDQHKKLNNTKKDLPIFWVFPYFMEPQIQNSLPNFSMLDYKVDYDNHPLFQDKGRKLGSPVRLFTNIDPSLVKLPEDYKFCEICNRWVSQENQHCNACNSCTSKDGRTYIHCRECKRCVKPSWQHCGKCDRCAQPDHKCGQVKFTQECFNCKKPGHKKRDCPQVDQSKLQMKRKIKLEKRKSKFIKRS